MTLIHVKHDTNSCDCQALELFTSLLRENTKKALPVSPCIIILFQLMKVGQSMKFSEMEIGFAAIYIFNWVAYGIISSCICINYIQLFVPLFAVVHVPRQNECHLEPWLHYLPGLNVVNIDYHVFDLFYRTSVLPLNIYEGKTSGYI